MEIDFLTVPKTAIEHNKAIAYIDDTFANDIKIILIDKPDKYVQRFFIKNDYKQMIEHTKTMRMIGIPSL